MSQVRVKKHGLGDADTRTDSQQLLALGELLRKPTGDKAEIKEFQAQATKDQKAMKELLRQRFQQAQERDVRRRKEVASLIANALQHSSQPAHHDAATYPNTNIGTNSIFESAGKVNTACKSLVSEYNAFEDMIAEMAGDNQSQVTETWAQDVAETERQLRLGHKVALRNVKKLLGASNGEHETEAADDEERENGGMKGAELNYELLKTLRYTERGVKRIVKGLPTEG